MAVQTQSSAAAGAAGPAHDGPNPESILKLASGFMAAKHLFAASELGLFEALANSPATLDALAARTGLTRRAARISADAMVGLGLLERDGDTYRNGATAAVFLAGAGPADLRPFLRFWDKISYPAWTRLAESLARGPSQEIFDLDDSLQEVASSGIESILAGPASALAANYDFGRHRRLLDIGGGTGSWTIAVARRHAQMAGTVFDLPTVAELARGRLKAAGLSERVTVLAGDVMTDGALPTGYDVFLLANLVHYWSPEENRSFLSRLREVAEPGARVLLADFWTDPTHTQPLHAALMAGEFAVHMRNGDVYSVAEAQEWLEATGWTFVEHAQLAGPQSVVVAEVRAER